MIRKKKSLLLHKIQNLINRYLLVFRRFFLFYMSRTKFYVIEICNQVSVVWHGQNTYIIYHIIFQYLTLKIPLKLIQPFQKFSVLFICIDYSMLVFINLNLSFQSYSLRNNEEIIINSIIIIIINYQIYGFFLEYILMFAW